MTGAGTDVDDQTDVGEVIDVDGVGSIDVDALESYLTERLDRE